MNDDPQGSNWWLASDGNWYPPELHPDVRSSALLDDEDRFAALFDAALGVARVREKVVAQASGGRRSGYSTAGNGNDTHLGAQRVTAGRRASDQGVGVRHGIEPPPRFRSGESTNWPYETRDPTTADPTRAETRQRPGTRERPAHEPPPWSPSGYDRGPPARPAADPRPPAEARPETRPDLSWPPLRGSSTAPLSPPATPADLGKRVEPGWPPGRGSSSVPSPHEPASAPPRPAPPLPEPEPAQAAGPLPPLPEPPVPPPPPPPAPFPPLPEPPVPPPTPPSPAPLPPLSESPVASPASSLPEPEPAAASALPGPEPARLEQELSAPALTESEPASPAPVPDSAPGPNSLPPTARRRRPSTGRPAAELRQAVAGAVARAAAQGPLVPPTPEESALIPEALQPAPLWPKSRRRPVPFPAVHTSSVPDRPTDPAPAEAATELTPAELAPTEAAPAELPHAELQATERPPTVPTGAADVEPQVLDPYEEFARLAGRHATVGVASNRYTDRSSTLPAGTLDLESGTQSEPEESVFVAPPAFEPSPLWLASRAGPYPMDIAIQDPPASPVVDVGDVVDESSPPSDPYEDFADPARSHDTARTAPAGEADGASDEANSPALDTTTPESASTDGPPRDSTSVAVAPASATGPEPSDREPHQQEPSEPQAPRSEEETAWPVGERRSAARQARKPLPAALQAAVASGTTPGGAAGASSPQRVVSKQTRGSQKGPGTDKLTSKGKPPGILRRYASAIAVVALFVAAGGAAAGIAALRGPIAQTGLPTPAQDRAAANHIVLKASDFPPGWQFSSGGPSASNSYGFGSVLFAPSIVHFWVTAHPACATTLNTLSPAMMPSAGHPRVVVSTHAAIQPPLGPTWQIASAVAFHSTAHQVTDQMSSIRSLLAAPGARACISEFWSAALLTELPVDSHVVTTVSDTVLTLPGNPSSWAMSIDGVDTVRQVALPIHFEIAEFAAGRAQVSLAAASKIAPLDAGLDQSLLTTLATRAQHFAS